MSIDKSQWTIEDYRASAAKLREALAGATFDAEVQRRALARKDYVVIEVMVSGDCSAHQDTEDQR